MQWRGKGARSDPYYLSKESFTVCEQGRRQRLGQRDGLSKETLRVGVDRRGERDRSGRYGLSEITFGVGKQCRRQVDGAGRDRLRKEPVRVRVKCGCEGDRACRDSLGKKCFGVRVKRRRQRSSCRYAVPGRKPGQRPDRRAAVGKLIADVAEGYPRIDGVAG